MTMQVILASASPRRKELLERIGFSVKTIPSNIVELRDEEEAPENFVKRMARTKVLSVVERLRTTIYTAEGEAAQRPRRALTNPKEAGARWVIGADTIVVLGDDILGKPKDNADAVEALMRLSGREHIVITGFCVFDMRKNKEGLQAVTSTVNFKAISPAEAERYVSVGESLDKAGGYAVQGVGAYLVEYINGSYTNVVGLPLCQVVEMMQEMGAEEVLAFC
jgi:septum formation protein